MFLGAITFGQLLSTLLITDIMSVAIMWSFYSICHNHYGAKSKGDASKYFLVH